MRDLLKGITPPVLWRFMQDIVQRRKKYYGLNMLDQKIERHVDYDNGYFVELGANDGISQSNTLYFETRRNWNGILVEPTPHNYLKCLANRSDRNRIFCHACVSFDYREKFVEIAFADLMSSPIGLESDIANPAEHARFGERFLGPKEGSISFGAVARTLNQILIDADAPKIIDLLSLDVEGAEIEVLKGVDHTAYRFRFMCLECRDIEKMAEYLRQHGYDLVEKLSCHDYLFRDAASGTQRESGTLRN